MRDALWDQWVADWEWVLTCMRAKGPPVVVEPLRIDPPISRERLDEIVRYVGPLPEDYIDVVTTRSARVSFHWRLFDDDDEIEPPIEIFRPPIPRGRQRTSFGAIPPPWGGRHMANDTALWDAHDLPRLKDEYDNWLEVCWRPTLEEFPGDPYALEWLDKRPFLDASHGDFLSWDATGHVVYLCHDDGCTIHGQRIAPSFTDLVTWWSRVGCVGPEGDGFEAFVEEGGCDSRTDVVNEWRAWVESAP